MSGSIWDKSSFLDLTGFGISNATTPEQAYGLAQPVPAAGSLTVALVLPRLTDPTTLLGGSWAQREAALNGLTPAQIGAEYGASPAQYAALTAYLQTVSGATLLPSSQGYVSSAASRTVWVSLNSQAFQTLFGQPLMSGNTNTSTIFWDGKLSPNAAVSGLAGLWVVTSAQPNTSVQNTTGETLTSGPQGIGNTSGGGYNGSTKGVSNQALYPNQIAAEYHFPLTASGIATPTVGVSEPGIGTAVPAGDEPNQLLQRYRASAGIEGTGTISDGPDQPAGILDADADERSLDIGTIAAAAPNSNIVAEDGATTGSPFSGTYTAMEEAAWGGGPKLADLSASYRIGTRVAPGSPFAAALQGLYEDMALNNISVFQASGDGGSSAELPTGVPQVNTSNVSAYTVSVGGTSTTSQVQVTAAGAADTGGAPNINAGIAAIAQQAEAGGVAALEMLVTSGLTQNPTASSNIAAFLQTVWNEYVYDAAGGTLTKPYDKNYATGGGVDPAIPEPTYQTNAGIDTQALAQAAGVPGAASGKGDPDVSAVAGSTTSYIFPGPDLTGTMTGGGGTSAATPLWAALTAQIQAVFADQGLPTTGYFDDLLYVAATIDPGAFDDVLFGSNTSSFIYDADGPVKQPDGTEIRPTGLGYSAGPGYDLATGLGTPDGILLARALTQIAQAEIYDPDAVPVTDTTGTTSAAAQALIVQPTLASDFSGAIGVGPAAFTPASDGSGQGWSARIAQQSLQSYFAPALAQAIAGQAQASSEQIAVTDGQSLGVTIGGVAATPAAQQDTAPYGFVTDTAGVNAVTLARPLAVAETYGGQDDTDAIVRIRQDSADADALTFYRVDDLDGDIGGLAPGQAGYAAASANRAYRFANGRTSEVGPGDGQFAQADLTGVNDGDIVAVEMTDATSGQTTWGLAAQNAGGVNDLWSYGADTWGLDDGSAGGAGFTSMVFQLDFTSNAGHRLLAGDSGTPAPIPTSPSPLGVVSISPNVVHANGAFIITGTASSPAGVRSVEISALVDGVRENLGDATVDPDGTFTFGDAAGDQQTFIVATLTNGAGGQVDSVDPGFNLTGGLGARGSGERQENFSSTEQVSSILFRANGARQISLEAPGQTVDLQPYDVVFNHLRSASTFVYMPSGETGSIDTIHGFNADGADHDVLSLKGADFDDAIADVLRNTGDVEGSAFVTDPVTGDTIRLAGVSRSDLKRKDVTFHA